MRLRDRFRAAFESFFRPAASGRYRVVIGCNEGYMVDIDAGAFSTFGEAQARCPSVPYGVLDTATGSLWWCEVPA